MSQASLIAIASMCLTVHSVRSPPGGCCVDLGDGGWSLTQTYPLSEDEVYDQLPANADCGEEISGVQAASADGKAVQDMSVHCSLEYNELVTVRSLDLLLPNGTDLWSMIIYHPNGTVEADCHFGSPPSQQSSQEDSCIGPNYHDEDEFVGFVTYGSLVAERYGNSRVPGAYVDLDADHGCIPIKSMEFTITNWSIEEPAESLFAIPPECFQQGAKAAVPVKHTKRVLPFQRRSSSVVV